MRAVRRLVQAVAIAGTILVGVVALALIVSQTPWFRGWLRGYIERQANAYLEGKLSIGRLGGNLFFGVRLTDVAVHLEGQPIVRIPSVEVDYSILEVISQGAVIDELRLVEPRLHLARDRQGWNIGRLVAEREVEADREGPARPIALHSIVISGGSLQIDDAVGTSGYTLPDRVDGLDVRASFQYAPVRYTVEIDHVGLRASSPAISLEELTGTLAVRDDNVYFEDLAIRLAETALTIDGVIEGYQRTPVVKLRTAGRASLPELGRIVPQLAEYRLRPEFDVRATGPLDNLAMSLDVQSEAGKIKGDVTADVNAPGYRVAGDVELTRFDLAPVLRDPQQRSDITGQASFDLRLAGTTDAPALERLRGTFSFSGPRVSAAGYEATSVDARGAIAGRRLEIDARAAAYGGRAAAKGFIMLPVERQPLAFDLRGSAADLDLRNLRAVTAVPALETDLSVAEYHVQGQGRTISGSARLDESVVEGATIGAGTVAEFRTEAGAISYSARGLISNLDLERLGRALKVEALARPEYASRITSTFDVSGAGTSLEELRLDASGTLTDSAIMGARLPQMFFETHLQEGALAGRVKGSFEDVNPARFANRRDLTGQVSGTADAAFRVDDLDGPITPDTVAVEGEVALKPSLVGAIQIGRAIVRGQYAQRTGEIAQLEVDGPDVTVKAWGRLALDRTSSSEITYHADVANLAEIGKVAGQPGLSGSAIVDGKLTGNAAELRIAGTLNGANLGQGENTALDLDSEYTVVVPELTFGDAAVQATSRANFVKIGGMDLKQIVATTTYAGGQLEFSTRLSEERRELEAGGSVIFHPDHQEIHLPQLAIRTEEQLWTLAPQTEAAVQYGGGRITVQNLQLVSDGQRLQVDGTLVTGNENGEEPNGRFEVTAEALDLAQLERLLLQNRGISGRLDAKATITGSLERPDVEGHVEIVSGAFRDYRYESLVADVQYGQDRIALDAKLQQSATEAITASGSVPMSLFRPGDPGHIPPSEEDAVDLRIQSTALGLGLIQGFTTQVTNVTGTLQADVRITGSGQDPHLEGHVEIRNGAFGVPAVGVSYSGLDTRLDLLPDVVRIQQFTILDEHGAPLNVSGDIAVHERQVGAVNVELSSTNFEVLDNELGDIGLDTKIQITGELRRPRITGDVRVARGRVELDRILQLVADPYSVEALPPVVSADREAERFGTTEAAAQQAITRAGSRGVEPVPDLPEAPVEAGALSPLALDLRVRIPDNLVVRGSDLRPGGPTAMAVGDVNITLGGDVKVLKDPGEPLRLVGTVNTVRGTYEFQGRRFALERGGTIRFTGDPSIEPLLDVVATRQIPNTGVEVQLRIGGTTRAPELTLSSTPPLEESDILSLIVFNRPLNELGTGERASLAATAGGIATGFIAAPLGESIGRALDLDLFEITTTSETGELEAGITIGQQIGERMFFRLRQQFGDRNVSEFMLEYQIARFLRLQTSLAPETAGAGNRLGQRRVERVGIDLIFFFSY